MPISIDEYKAKMERLAPTPEDMRIFWVGKDIARIEARTTYCLECIYKGEGVAAALDDMAQVIGYEARLIEDNEKDIIDALMDNAAVLVKPSVEAKGGASHKVEATGLRGEAAREVAMTNREEHSVWDRGYAITTGRDPYEAYVALVVLEKAAEIQIKSDAFGGTKELSKAHCKNERRRYLKKYSAPGLARRKTELGQKKIRDGLARENQEASGASEEWDSGAETLVNNLKGRQSLVKYGNLLVEKNLVQGTWGNISVRIDDEYMLTTPTGLDYDNCKPEDMVRVNIESLAWDESESAPTTEKGLHGGIYRVRQDVGAVVHTHSKYCSLLAACQMPLEVREEALAKEIGELIYVADYGEAGSDRLTNKVIEALGDRTGCIMSNHGMVAVGADIETAFNNALSMEEAARRLINEKLADKAN